MANDVSLKKLILVPSLITLAATLLLVAVTTLTAQERVDEGLAARVQAKVPLRCTEMTASQSASLMLSASVVCSSGGRSSARMVCPGAITVSQRQVFSSWRTLPGQG